MKEKIRQKLIKNAGGNFVYLPKTVCRAYGLDWCAAHHVTISEALRLGASEFSVPEEGNGIKAKWPSFIFDLATRIKDTFTGNQHVWLPRDCAALQEAVGLWAKGRIDEALEVVCNHQGIPAEEMPDSYLDQIGGL